MITRRIFMAGLPLLLAACTTTGKTRVLDGEGNAHVDPFYSAMYGPVPDEPFPVSPVDLRRVNPQFWRTEVDYQTTHAPGTIIVDTPAHYLYFVEAGGRAIRYGVGVGKTEALQFKGNAVIGRKAEWPNWTPTTNMIHRDPDRYASYASGMPGGPTNPLGPRALYLYRDGTDTHFRMHGTIEPYTIGTNVSSGCIRLMNQDIIDLYGRVNAGTRVVVLQA